jgi:hypothetical protein
MTHEREITEPVDLCDGRGRLSAAARGWSRRPLHLANLRGPWGRRKRWDYWCVISDEVVVSITYADVDYIGLANVWVLDQATGRHWAAGSMKPAARGISLPDEPCTGTMSARGATIEVTLQETPTQTQLRVVGTSRDGAPIDVDVVVAKPDGHEGLNVVIPWSDRRFQFTSKQNTRPATGVVRVGESSWILDAAHDAWGVLDLGRGIWPYRNRWNWAAGSGHAVDGSLVGVQMGGKWTEGTGHTENALCIDGHLTKIGEELRWDYSWDDPMRPWRVRTPGGGAGSIDLELTPTFDRHDRTSLGVLSMEVHQCFGTWSGTVVGDDGVERRLDGLRGFAEEARNRW